MIAVKKPGERASVALGCMNFGKRTPEAEAHRIVARAIERGVTLFDIANAYNDGESERILGRAMRGRREAMQIATKVGFGRVAGKSEGLSRARVLTAIDESLDRLGTDYVDVYYLHAPDHHTPIDETLAAMAELVEAGKVRALGVSNYAAWQILDMMVMAGARGTPRPVISQVMYNLLIRQIDVEYAGFARERRIHTTVYNPLAGGLLTGRHARAREATGDGDAPGKPGAIPAPPAGSRFEKNRLYQGRYWSDRFFDLVEVYGALAREHGMSLVELSYAWLAGREVTDSILIGPGSIEHLDAALDACEKILSADLRARVDDVHRASSGTDASYVR